MIDAHQHLWRIGEHGSTWPTADLVAIHRHFDLENLVAVAEPLGIEGTVLVQSQPDDRDTDWLLQIAERSAFVKGVVGWVDLASPLAPRRIAELAKRPKMRGLRPMLQHGWKWRSIAAAGWTRVHGGHCSGETREPFMVSPTSFR